MLSHAIALASSKEGNMNLFLFALFNQKTLNLSERERT